MTKPGDRTPDSKNDHEGILKPYGSLAIENLRHTSPVSEDKIVVGNRSMAAEALLNEARVIALHLIISSS